MTQSKRTIAMNRLLPIVAVLALTANFASLAQATPRTRVEYIVTETNPFTGGVQSATRFTDKASADRHFATLGKVRWVKWRFAGINEPLKFRRFVSSAAAQNFIETDGPSKTGKLGFAILTNETRNVAGKVKLTSETVPVTGGGNGGGRPVEVIDVIDRIIGVIDR